MPSWSTWPSTVSDSDISMPHPTLSNPSSFTPLHVPTWRPPERGSEWMRTTNLPSPLGAREAMGPSANANGQLSLLIAMGALLTNHSTSLHRTTLILGNNRLTRLPAELRNTIYFYAVEPTNCIIRSHTANTKSVHKKKCYLTLWREPALLQTSKQIRMETMPIYWLNQQFAIRLRSNHFGMLYKWLNFLSKQLGGQWPCVRIRVVAPGWIDVDSWLSLAKLAFESHGMHKGGKSIHSIARHRGPQISEALYHIAGLGESGKAQQHGTFPRSSASGSRRKGRSRSAIARGRRCCTIGSQQERERKLKELRGSGTRETCVIGRQRARNA
jgi:hypothetical protein